MPFNNFIPTKELQHSSLGYNLPPNINFTGNLGKNISSNTICKPSTPNKKDIFDLNNIWIILKGGKCIFEYHTNDFIKLNSVLFGGFIYAIHSFSYELIDHGLDRGLDKLKIQDFNFKFVNLGKINILGLTTDGLNEKIIKNYLYKIGERFIKIHYNNINNDTFDWRGFQQLFCNEVEEIKLDRNIRNTVILDTIKELIIIAQDSDDDILDFYRNVIKLMKNIPIRDIIELNNSIKIFLTEMDKMESNNFISRLKSNFEYISDYFLNSSVTDVQNIDSFSKIIVSDEIVIKYLLNTVK